MNTTDLVTATYNKIGKTAFVNDMDSIGWRGDYGANPKQYLFDYMNNANDADKQEAEDIVWNDMIYILNLNGYDLDYNIDSYKIVNIIAH